MPNKNSLRALAWNRKNPERAADKTFNWRLRRFYGIERSDLEAMRSEQKGKCAIASCQNGADYIDHDHVTGKVRGLLCRTCNFLLGAANDSTQFLRDAAQYLEDSSRREDLKGGKPLPLKGGPGMSTEEREWRRALMMGNTHGFQKGHKMGIGRKLKPETLEKMRRNGKARWDSMTDEERRIQWNKDHPTRASAGEKPSHHGKVR
jgi:hypothetical protein